MTKRQWSTWIFVCAALVASWFVRGPSIPSGYRSAEPPPLKIRGDATSSTRDEGDSGSAVSPTRITTNALVVRVVDGDTVEAQIDGQPHPAKIRLLGINTPESVDPRRAVQCFGKEASAYVKHLIEGKRVALKEDVQADDRDKYGRFLRNVVLEDGTDFNALLVKEGYAYAYVSFPLEKRRKEEMRRLQEEARVAKRGLWSKDTCDGMK